MTDEDPFAQIRREWHQLQRRKARSRQQLEKAGTETQIRKKLDINDEPVASFSPGISDSCDFKGLKI